MIAPVEHGGRRALGRVVVRSAASDALPVLVLVSGGGPAGSGGARGTAASSLGGGGGGGGAAPLLSLPGGGRSNSGNSRRLPPGRVSRVFSRVFRVFSYCVLWRVISCVFLLFFVFLLFVLICIDLSRDLLLGSSALFSLAQAASRRSSDFRRTRCSRASLLSRAFFGSGPRGSGGAPGGGPRASSGGGGGGREGGGGDGGGGGGGFDILFYFGISAAPSHCG